MVEEGLKKYYETGRYPEEVKEYAVQLVKEGCSYYYVAKRLVEMGYTGASPMVVRQWCLKRGVKSRHKFGGFQKLKESDLEVIKKLYLEGIPEQQIADLLGVTDANIRYWRRKLGLPRRRRWGTQPSSQ